MEGGKLKRYRPPRVGVRQWMVGETDDDPVLMQNGETFYLASEVDASHPREYTAESIGEAPEGWYWLEVEQDLVGGGCAHSWCQEFQFSVGHAREAVAGSRADIEHALTGRITGAFGPIPQPPSTPTEQA